MATGIEKKYKQWLISLVSGGKYNYMRDYSEVLGVLFETPFTYDIHMDENRAMDGVFLRGKFDRTRPRSSESVEKSLEGSPCNYLEMYVALSIRCYDTFLSGDRTKKQGPWTVMDDISENIGLINYPNGRVKDVQNLLKTVVKNVIFKKRLREPKEIWWQMIDYLG